jgi:hypothetical protein
MSAGLEERAQQGSDDGQIHDSAGASGYLPFMAQPTKPNRRSYVLDRGFQLKYTLMLVFAGGLVSTLFGLMMYAVHHDATRMLDLPESVRKQLDQSDATLVWLMVVTTLLMAVALGLFGLLVTHRVAGPVYVMSHYMSVLAKGRYPMMRPLRKRDELKSFFERFQTAVEALRSREADEARMLEDAVKTLSPFASTSEAKGALQNLEALKLRKRDATDSVNVGGGAA